MSLLPDKHPLTAWRGGTYKKRWTLYNGATATAGQERNLTGSTATFIIKNPTTDAVLLSLSTTPTAAGSLTLGGTAGTIDLLITDETTAAAVWSSGVYELLLTSAGGETDPLLFGPFVIKGS